MGMIKKFNVWITPFNQERMIHLYLPDDYHESRERYPVVYMFDGHNLFENRMATYGKSWGLKKFLDHYDKKFIVVGIECNHVGNERINEYCPYYLEKAYLGPIYGRGAVFMDWLVYELKPFIDHSYRTIPFRECTAIAGSSMGGLMAYYAVVKYNEFFSKAACLSPSLMLCTGRILDEVNQNDIRADTKVYLSVGTSEVRYPSYLWQFNDAIIKKGGKAYVYIQEGGKHQEESWGQQNQLYFDYLWK